MSISLFTAFGKFIILISPIYLLCCCCTTGIWCFHMVRHLVVRPQGKHRPYTEVSFMLQSNYYAISNWHGI
jgi:hypothetical protein